MIGSQITRRANRLAMVALAVSFVGLFATSPSLAEIAIAVNADFVRISDDGRHLVLTGILLCDDVGAGDQITLYLTVTQRQRDPKTDEPRAAIATGSTHFVCTGGFFNDQWEVHATAHGNEEFFPGLVKSAGLAVSTKRNDTTSAFQWLTNIPRQ